MRPHILVVEDEKHLGVGIKYNLEAENYRVTLVEDCATALRLADPWGGELDLEFQLDWVRARFTSGDRRNIPRVTPIRWGGGLAFRGDAFRARVSALRNERADRTAVADPVSP